MKRGALKRFLEFLVVGLVFGVVEDVIAVLLTTDAEVSVEMIGIIVLVAIPFAALSELVVDHPEFTRFDDLADRLRGGRAKSTGRERDR